MKIKINFRTLVPFCALIMLACNNTKETNAQTKGKAVQKDAKTEKQAAASSNIELQVPDFADPAIKQYYASYTAYIKKVVNAIRKKDEDATMKIFREEGKQFDNRNEMEQKARATPGEEQKFTTWLMQSMPFQTEIIQSEYYKKFSEEYYKKVNEKVKAMDKK